MDFQNRAGSKPGSGGPAGAAEAHADRRERLRKLALETIDLSKDPYFMRNHLGSYECKLCLTLHGNEGSYLAHTQGKKHQANLGRRAAREAVDGGVAGMIGGVAVPGIGSKIQPPLAAIIKKNFVKIGRPGYKITKIKDPYTHQPGLLFQIQYPDITYSVTPYHRFMSAFEQRVETPPPKGYQFVVFAAEPYETVAFRIQTREVDRAGDGFFTHWDSDAKQYTLQFLFKTAADGNVSMDQS